MCVPARWKGRGERGVDESRDGIGSGSARAPLQREGHQLEGFDGTDHGVGVPVREGRDEQYPFDIVLFGPKFN